MAVEATIGAVVTKVYELSFEQIRRQILYPLKCKENIDKLKGQVACLRTQIEIVESRWEEAKNNGEEILPGVQEWLSAVDKFMKEKADKLPGDEGIENTKCLRGFFPDLKKRYQLSRKAVKEAQVCEELNKQGKFDKISCPRRPQGAAQLIKDYEAFESRALISKEILEALTDHNVSLIGVYGMGGVGKTTLMAEIAYQVKQDKLFDMVVVALVSRDPDQGRIQKEIADCLLFNFGSAQTVAGRADSLSWRLKKEQKVLVILDDIWAKVNLRELGIPYGSDHKGCKVLMVSRDLNVLSRGMDTQKNFCLQALNRKEAWNLFEKTQGGAVKDPRIQSIAREISERCAGLPIALVTLASQLRNAELHHWEDARTQLNRGFDNDGEVSKAIEWSYKFLKGEDIKSLFLLCGRFESNFILIRDLFMYSWGLGLFRQTNTLEEARNRLHKLLDDLKASCLLMEGDTHEQVKMHDVIHDFAVSTASKEDHVFAVFPDNEVKWPTEHAFQECTAVSLLKCRMSELPEVLECPKLNYLHLGSVNPSLKIPDMFFAKVENLKVLDLRKMHFSSLPSSLQFLGNLRTLCLDECILDDVAIVGELKKLDVLSFGGSNIVSLPKEIAQLTALQILDLRNCRELKVIPRNVLSCLTQLHDLYLKNSFVNWEHEGSNSQGFSAKLVELKHLSSLTTLDIHITDVTMIPRGLFPGKLKRFKIFIGGRWDWFGKYETSKTLKLELNTNVRLEEGVKALLQDTEDLYLGEMVGIRNVLYELDLNIGGFCQMKHLHVQNSSDIQYVVNSTSMGQYIAFPVLESLYLDSLSNLEMISCGQLTAESFSNLRKLEVGNCGKVRSLFSFSIAQGLQRLEDIKVSDCNNLEAIVAVEMGQHGVSYDEPVNLTLLRSLTLEYLPQFTSFCFKEVKAPSARSQTRRNIALDDEFGDSLPLFSSKVVLSNLDTLKLVSIETEKIWCDEVRLLQCFTKLATLKVVGCKNLKYLLIPSIVESLGQLKRLEIDDCGSMEEIIVTSEAKGERMSKIVFFNLIRLNLKNLPKLKRFCTGDLIECPSLKHITIYNCPELKIFISDSRNAELNAINEPEIKNSALFDEKVAFPNLEVLQIYDMPNLKMIWHHELRDHSFGNLIELTIHRAKSLLKIFPSNMLLRFRNVENLELRSCMSIEEAFDLTSVGETHGAATTHTKLRVLCIWYLPNLKCVWNQDPRGILNFQNIRKVVALKCPMLTSLFPASVAKCLPQLNELDIFMCKAMKEIVAKEEDIEEIPTFVFPNFKTLKFQHLEELSSFYPGKHSLECPVLDELRVIHCHKLQTYAPESQHIPETHTDDQLELQLHQPLFLFREVISKLKEASIASEDARMIAHGQFSADLFNRVNLLNMCCFHDGSLGFPFHLLQKFQNVDSLRLQRCHFEVLFSRGCEKDYASALAKITYIELWLLPDLKQIWNEESHQVVPNLSILEVKECRHLMTFAPSSASFRNLTSLYSKWCHSLISFITSSTARSLIKLVKMEIRETNCVREIVADKGDECEDEIVFTKLENLILIDMKSLTSFYPGRCTMKFPSLQKLIVERCPKMKTFSEGTLKTPKLQTVFLTETRDRERWKGELNGTIQQLYKDQHPE